MPAPAVNLLLDDTRIDASVRRAVRQAMSMAEVRETDADPTLLTIRLKLSQRPDGTWFPIDQDVFVPASRLRLEIVAPGGRPVRLFDGRITHVRPHFETIEANCYLEVIAQDIGGWMNVGDRAASFPDLSDAAAVVAVLDEWGITDVMAPSPSLDNPERHTLLIQRESDWMFLQRLAARNGFRCWLEPNGESVRAWFGPPDLSEPQPDLIILQDGANLKWLDLQYTAARTIRHAGQQLDPLEKRVLMAEADGLLASADGTELVSEIAKSLAEEGLPEPEGWLPTGPARSAAMEGRSRAANDADRFALEARGEIDTALYRGLLRARRTVLIRGVGSRHSGRWYVRAVRTAFQEGVLTQTFLAERLDIDLSGREDFGASAEEEGPR
ncbi:MAG: hypothetical protein AAFV53_11660 [Myxococcota bacterium]